MSKPGREAVGGVLSSLALSASRGEENEFMQALSDSYAFWIALFVALTAVYLLPSMVGMIRGVDRLALVFLVNLIGGPTGIGWLADMILALGPRRVAPAPQVPPWPGMMQGTGEAWMPGHRDLW